MFIQIFFLFLGYLSIIAQANNCTTSSIKDISDKETLFFKDLPIVMSDKERVLFYRTLQKSKVYFEYGCGGSTKVACLVPSIKSIITIESSDSFLNNLITGFSCLKEANSTGRVLPIHANIGKTGVWGFPLQKELSHRFKVYPEAIKTYKDMNPDVVLVDGRFRVACALNTLFYAPKAKVFIHDFSWRPNYHYILKYFDTIDCADSLFLFQAKSNINQDELLADIQRFSKTVDR